jgi:hypothetical protein
VEVLLQAEAKCAERLQDGSLRVVARTPEGERTITGKTLRHPWLRRALPLWRLLREPKRVALLEGAICRRRTSVCR